MSETAPSPPTHLPARRLDAARHLLQPRHLRGSFALQRQPSMRNAMLAGAQAAVTVAIALPLAYLSPWPHLIGYASLGALVALFGRFSPERRRNGIVFICAVCQTLAVLVMSTAVWAGLPETGQLVLLALSCGVFFFVAVTAQVGPPGALIFVFAVGASMHDVGSFQVVLERTAAVAVVATLAWAICAATEALRHHPTAERPLPVDPVPPVADRFVAALRISAGAGLAVFACHAIGAPHPAWAAMGAHAVMQGAHLHINMHRALQRMTGTVLGALIAWAVLSQAPSLWVVVAALVLLQFLTEVIIGSNYGLGQILVTPMALLMTHLAAPHIAGAEMAPERVLDTVLGASIGMVVAVLLSSLEDRHRLARHVLAT
ncbi:FUSC family protein [Acuticoccus sediminis]|uniref:FUSC family protein n=1 Tax=Acuticoccus sediminis TaxID=2184697 RepID=A0A8B2NP82_9HYPH|nr:FUSC family protein [Acuticoccus sediminis]RAI00492.1 FUSC family protein [Acuticoccus sediminis]